MKAQTSLEAFKNMQLKIPNDHQVILSVLVDDTSFTYHEISHAIKSNFMFRREYSKIIEWQNPVKVMRRMSELVRLEKVEVCETRICTIAKSNCKTYRLLTTKTE